MDYRDGKWAKQIIGFQKDDGTWGDIFHSLSWPTKKYPMTMEQALRRLRILGFALEDVPVRRAVDCMTSCLRGEREIDDYREKSHDWPLFTQLMLSTWVKVFDTRNELALNFAKRWAEVIEKAVESGSYSYDDYINAYVYEFSSKPKGPREIDPTAFYHMLLLQGILSRETENRFLDYVIAKPNGIYYIYGKPINKLPEVFASREASFYVGALEILSGYDLAKEKLGFAVDWLNANKDVNGQWDFGAKTNDGVYFPLSDSWKRTEDRLADCTQRVKALLQKLGSAVV